MTESSGAPDDERVLVLAPFGRDGQLARTILTDAGFAACLCPAMSDLVREIATGAGALFLSEEALLSGESFASLRGAVAAQPPWSDLPIIVVASEDITAGSSRRTFERVEGLGHVTLLERPLRLLTLVSTVRTALLARRRQYQTRFLLERLEDAVEQRDRFLAMLGHELRNPLAAITYATHVLPDVDGARHPRAVIERQTAHLARIVDDLLDVARVKSGKIVLQRRSLDLRDLVARCVEAMGPAVRDHALALGLDEAPVLADVDPVRMEQVVSNLLTNAVKYTPRGGHIAVRVTREGSHAVVAIEDDGAGISPELLPRVFDLFAQADTTLDRAGGGLGIGLTVVRGLVEQHGGTVRATSEGTGRGSRFEVRMPMGATSPAPTDRPRAASPIPAEKLARRVLIVEDEPDSREMLALLLESAGHGVEAVDNGSDGVERACAMQPDVALVDIGLPKMNGYDVARSIRRELGARVFLVALTGYGQSEDRARARSAGFDAHLTKPIDVERLDRLIREAPAAPVH